jgi:hypothetical protein
MTKNILKGEQMNTLNKLENLVGKEYLVKSIEKEAFCKQDENNSRQANNNRIVDLVLNLPDQETRPLN